jgi:hypothetical protein
MKASTKIWSVVAIAITLFVCGDLVLSGCMSYFYHQSKYGIFHCQIYSLTESKEDVPILNFFVLKVTMMQQTLHNVHWIPRDSQKQRLQSMTIIRAFVNKFPL